MRLFQVSCSTGGGHIAVCHTVCDPPVPVSSPSSLLWGWESRAREVSSHVEIPPIPCCFVKPLALGGWQTPLAPVCWVTCSYAVPTPSSSQDGAQDYPRMQTAAICRTLLLQKPVLCNSALTAPGLGGSLRRARTYSRAPAAQPRGSHQPCHHLPVWLLYGHLCPCPQPVTHCSARKPRVPC